MGLHLKDLVIGHKTKHGESPLCEPINCEFKPAGLHTFVGLNGAGKTTLLKTIAGLTPSLDGQVLIQGKEVAGLQKNILSKKISLVLTQALASENMTVYELVSMGRYPYLNWIAKLGKHDLEIISKSLQYVGIEELAQEKIHELSDGQKQKVLIAKALAQDTPFILLDEPMSHLDLHHKAQLLKLLVTLASDFKKTIIYSTHDIEMALQFSDYTLVIHQNKFSYGSPEKLVTAGVFNELFPKDHIRFDSQSRQFYYSGLDTK